MATEHPGMFRPLRGRPTIFVAILAPDTFNSFNRILSEETQKKILPWFSCHGILNQSCESLQLLLGCLDLAENTRNRIGREKRERKKKKNLINPSKKKWQIMRVLC